MHTHTHAHTYTLYVIRINNLHKKKPLNNLLFLYMLFVCFCLLFFCFCFLVYNVCLLLMRYLALLCLAFVLIWSKVIVLGPMAGCALGSAEAVFLFVWATAVALLFLFSLFLVSFCWFFLLLFFWWAWALARAWPVTPPSIGSKPENAKVSYRFVSFEVHEFSLYY